MTDILQAARSYYGLADTDVRKTDIYTNEAGQPMLVFELALSAEDFIAIGARMKNMQEEVVTEPEPVFGEGPTTHAIRQQYNAMSKAEKAKYGSFGRYVTATSAGILEVQEEPAELNDAEKAVTECLTNLSAPARQVVHVDAPEEPEPVSMDAVWLSYVECNDAQKQYASDARWTNSEEPAREYLVQWAMLTDEQKQKAKESGK